MTEYRWLLVTRTDNGLHFYNIFETRELAVLHVADVVDPEAWTEDASGDLSFIQEGSYSYFISEEPYTPQTYCGGCEGIGNHKKHCRKNPNYDFRLWLADRAESVADVIGSNNTTAANFCYAAAWDLKEQVRKLREERHV